MKLRLPAYVFGDGSGAWSHVPGRIIFSTPDHTDPRTNGRHYVAHSPLLYSRTVAYSALAAFIAALLALRRLTPSESVPALAPADASPRFTLHVTAAALVFLAGLYFATGTLAPYANTLLSPPDPATGYLYNGDHATHRTLFAFVDGEPRAAWQDSLLLRRVLYAVLAWPWMHSLGFELGGVMFNLCANLLGFLAGVAMVRRHVGLRGATLAAWLFALYPGAAYWVGQPYAYALIFPLGIAAFWILLELSAARPARLALLSLALGTIYLTYDFHVYFLPASLLLLVWQRRWTAAAASAFLQILPLGVWLWVMKNVVRVPLENSNTGVYRELFVSFFTPRPFAETLPRLTALPETALDIFLGANFLFLPLLALLVWALDFSWSHFTRHRAVPALLAAGAALVHFLQFPAAAPHRVEPHGLVDRAPLSTAVPRARFLAGLVVAGTSAARPARPRLPRRPRRRHARRQRPRLLRPDHRTARAARRDGVLPFLRPHGSALGLRAQLAHPRPPPPRFPSSVAVIPRCPARAA
jgi:hypothetical protein